MIELLGYTFIQNSLLTALFASISCGIMGTYIVSRRMVFISGGITHASFGGIGIAYFMSVNPVIGASIFSVLMALGIEFFTNKLRLRNDSAIAIFWSFGMAIGIIFVYLTPGYAPNLMTYLFGSILSVTYGELLAQLLLSLSLIMVFGIFYYPILFISFDPEFARTRDLPVNSMNYLMIVLVALTIVINIKVSGIILMLSLLTIPQNTAMLFTNSFNRIIWLSIILGFSGTVAGIASSYYLNIPSGASIIFVLVLVYLIARILRYSIVNFSKLKIH